MTFFRRLVGGRRTLVPDEVLADLTGAITSPLITYDGCTLRSRPEPPPEYSDYVGPTFHAAQIDSSRTIKEVVDAAFAQGGWALYGGHQLLADAVGPDCAHPRYLALLDATLEFLQTAGCSGICLNATSSAAGSRCTDPWRPSETSKLSKYRRGSPRQSARP